MLAIIATLASTGCESILRPSSISDLRFESAEAVPQAPEWNIRLTFSMSGDYLAHAQAASYGVSYISVERCGGAEFGKALQVEYLTAQDCPRCGASDLNGQSYRYTTVIKAAEVSEIDYPVCAQLSAPGFFQAHTSNEARVPLAELKRAASEVQAKR